MNVNSSNPGTLLVIDGLSLAYRSFYSYPLTLTHENKPINAAFGFLSMLFSAVDRYNPTYLVVTFDVPEPNFREALYPEYKAHRDPPPSEFIDQIPVLKSCLDELKIARLELAGYEADDLMGTLAEHSINHLDHCLLMTGDKDAYQLVSKSTTVLINKKGISDIQEITPEFLNDTYQLTPSQMIDLKSLQGDRSDNIPGVTGVGEKTALKLLHQLGSLKGIYAQLEAIESDKVRQKLEKDKENAFLSYELATINCKVPIEFKLPSFKFDPNWTHIIEVFQKYTFKSLITRYHHHIEGPAVLLKEPDGTYECIDELESLKGILKHLKKGFSFDLETTSLDIYQAQIVGFSIAFKEKHAIYVPLNDSLKSTNDNLQLFANNELNQEFDIPPLLKIMVPFLEDPTIPKFTHNGKYERSVLKNYSIDLKGIACDTMLASFLINPNHKIGLKALVELHFNTQMTHYEDLIGEGKQQQSFSSVKISDATRYAAADADYTLRLTHLFNKELKKDTKLSSLLNDVELPVQDILADMEYRGVRLDSHALFKLQKQITKELDGLTNTIHELAGRPFNINSTKQLAEILYDDLKLKVVKKTKTGRSTDSSVLEKLVHDHPIADNLIRYRMLVKLQNTYISVLPQLVSPRFGRIHTSFHQAVTMTGRLSSSAPNLQNIPIRTSEGLGVREAFISSSVDYQLFSADYSQIELRILAHLSEDEAMIDAFKRDQDIHQSTASRVFGVKMDDVTKEQRDRAKAVNFGIIYGTSGFGLAQNLGIDRKEAQSIIDHYFQMFPNIKLFIDSTIANAREKGYVRTLLGRYRYIPEIKSPNFSKRGMGERMAVNTVVQGTAADIMKLAMIAVAKQLESYPQSHLIIQVHDELVLDIHADELNAVSEMVIREMEQVYPLKVPLKVDAMAGNNWKVLS